MCSDCRRPPVPGTNEDFADEHRRAVAIVVALRGHQTADIRVLVADLLPPLPRVRDEHDDPFGHILDVSRVAEVRALRQKIMRAVVALAALTDDALTSAFGPSGGDEWLAAQANRPLEGGGE